MRYIPNSQGDRERMLAEIGLDSIEQLFAGIPEKLRLRRLMNVPEGLTEPELLDYFRQWSGAYDFAALAKAADFLSFMTYDEHNGVTPPGAVSGTPWIRQALEFSLQGVPPEKATLGLPTYYHDWTGVGRLTSSSYDDAMILAQRYGATPALDAVEEEMHFGYDVYGVHHELWIQSSDTLRRKLPLMYEYGLKGISVWRLGFEDPSFWNLIPPRR